MLEGIFDRLNLGFCRAPWRKRHGVSSSVNAGANQQGLQKDLYKNTFFIRLYFAFFLAIYLDVSEK